MGVRKSSDVKWFIGRGADSQEGGGCEYVTGDGGVSVKIKIPKNESYILRGYPVWAPLQCQISLRGPGYK